MGFWTKAGSIFLRASKARGKETKELRLYIIAVVSLLVFGIAGFHWIEGWNLLDSLYMTVITLSTVGFQEAHPLSPAGRLFTIALIFFGVGVAMVVLPRLAGKFIEHQLRWLSERETMKDKIKALRGHTIFCGYGRLSHIATKQVAAAGKEVVIIDVSQERVDEARSVGYYAVHGDATSEEALREAGIEHAANLASLLPKDADNLYVVLTAHELNPRLVMLSRADDPGSEKRLMRAGATRILAPYRVGGEKIASGLLKPYVTDFLDLTSATGGPSKIQIEEIRIESGSPLAGVSLRAADLRKRTNIIVAAMISTAGQMQMNPGPDTIIEAGTTLIGFGTSEDFQELGSILERGAGST